MREYTTIQHRRGTEAQWNAANPVLALGEIGVEVSPTGVRFKVGDGASRWSEILYDDTSALRAEVVNLDASVGKALTGEVDPSRVPGIILDTSPLIPVTYDGNDLTHAWTDRDGRVALGIRRDATVTVPGGLEVAPGTLPLESLDAASLIGTTAADQWRYAFTDETGRISAGIDSSGAFRVFRGSGAPSSVRGHVICMGDSLTAGYADGEHWPAADAYPGHLAEDYPYLEVLNRGYTGRTADEIRVLTGSLALIVQPAGGSIPATGPVTLDTAQKVGWSGGNTIQIQGTLNGVPGALQRTPTAITFTRAIDGTAVSVPHPMPFIPAVRDFSSDTVVLWVGRNDVNQNIKGGHATVAEHVVASVLETVEWLAPRSASVVVLGTTNSVDETRGATKYETVIEINRRLAGLLPHKYADIRSYLVHEAIYDMGVTPTTEDLANMSNDAPPPSIWDTGSHYLKPAAPYVAQFIGSQLASKGFI